MGGVQVCREEGPSRAKWTSCNCSLKRSLSEVRASQGGRRCRGLSQSFLQRPCCSCAWGGAQALFPFSLTLTLSHIPPPPPPLSCSFSLCSSCLISIRVSNSECITNLVSTSLFHLLPWSHFFPLQPHSPPLLGVQASVYLQV